MLGLLPPIGLEIPVSAYGRVEANIGVGAPSQAVAQP